MTPTKCAIFAKIPSHFLRYRDKGNSPRNEIQKFFPAQSPYPNIPKNQNISAMYRIWLPAMPWPSSVPNLQTHSQLPPQDNLREELSFPIHIQIVLFRWQYPLFPRLSVSNLIFNLMITYNWSRNQLWKKRDVEP